MDYQNPKLKLLKKAFKNAFFEKKPAIEVEFLNDGQQTLF